MGKFDGILILSDLDGTLLKNDKSISFENLKAIEYFKQEGGIFTFVTGRMPFFALDMCEIVKPNAPFGCINGGALYDFVNRQYVWKRVMPNSVLELVRHVDENCSDIGIQVNTFCHTYFLRENESMRHFREHTAAPNLVRSYEQIEEEISKIVLGSEREEGILQMQDLLLSHPLAEQFDFIRSERVFFEILPKGIGKGTAVEQLVKYLGKKVRKTVAIGDYNNDISMFEVADLGIAVSNACEQAIAAADFVTVSNEDHAIAAVIEDLQERL